MSTILGLLGVPSSAGAFAPGQEKTPRAMRQMGLVTALREAEVAVVDHGDSPIWRWRPDRTQPTAQNLAAVAEQAQTTAARVREIVRIGQIPLVLGGDCTIELGVVAGHLPTQDRLGLLYFDLHPDLNVPASVPEGALDWMGVAHLLGIEGAAETLSRIGPRFPLLADDDLLLFAYGPEQSTPWEREIIERRGLHGIPVDAVRAAPEAAAATALAHLAARSDRFLVHFDVDVIDFTDAPLSENTGRNQGLSFAQAFAALRVLLASDRLAALTITELNPDHGEADGITLARFVAALVESFAGAVGGDR
jgi:arginase